MANLSSWRPQKSHILVLAMAGALFMHIGVLLWLHDMPLPFSGHSTPWSYQERHMSAAEMLEQREIAQKNLQLAHTFHQFLREVGKNDLSSQEDLDIQIVTTPDLSVLEHLLTSEITATPEQDFPKTSLDSFWIEEMEATADDTLKADIVLPNEEEWATELLRATEALSGQVDISTEFLDSKGTLAIGSNDKASQGGDALNSHSGLRDHEHIGEASSPASLLGSREQGSYGHRLDQQRRIEENALNHPLGSTDAQPLSAQDPLDPQIQTASHRPHIASSNDFDLVVEYAARRQGSGYLFKLSLHPRNDVIFRSIKHNIAFLIDRSHSIRYERYLATKKAVAEALSLLREGDTFNILFFDDQVNALSPHYLPVTKDSLDKARQFLDMQEHGSRFASTDLYASLENIVPEAVGEQELNSVILLSDGETYLNKEKQRQHISRWTQNNHGKVALYSLAIGPKDNLGLLDLLSTLNKGRLHYCNTASEVCGSLNTLLSSLRHPIGKELTTSVVTRRHGNKIQIAPTQESLPNLYRDIPYVLYGTCNHLEDFYLFIQGRYYNRFLDIKQEVVFKDAINIKAADLERQWAMIEAHNHYRNYLHDGSLTHITEARQLLKPHGIPAAFK